jgi:hypothetical protein
METEEILLAAWRVCAPQAETSRGFPRGFWPDVARVAVEITKQETAEPELDFRPTMCEIGRPEKATGSRSQRFTKQPSPSPLWRKQVQSKLIALKQELEDAD